MYTKISSSSMEQPPTDAKLIKTDLTTKKTRFNYSFVQINRFTEMKKISKYVTSQMDNKKSIIHPYAVYIDDMTGIADDSKFYDIEYDRSFSDDPIRYKYTIGENGENYIQTPNWKPLDGTAKFTSLTDTTKRSTSLDPMNGIFFAAASFTNMVANQYRTISKWCYSYMDDQNVLQTIYLDDRPIYIYGTFTPSKADYGLNKGKTYYIGSRYYPAILSSVLYDLCKDYEVSIPDYCSPNHKLPDNTQYLPDNTQYQSHIHLYEYDSSNPNKPCYYELPIRISLDVAESIYNPKEKEES